MKKTIRSLGAALLTMALPLTGATLMPYAAHAEPAQGSDVRGRSLGDGYNAERHENDVIRDYKSEYHETDVTRNYSYKEARDICEGSVRTQIRRNDQGSQYAVVIGVCGTKVTTMTVPSEVHLLNNQGTVSVTRIGDGAPIQGDPQTVDIPRGVTVAAQAFRGKNALTELTLHFNDVDPYAFAETKNLTAVHLPEDHGRTDHGNGRPTIRIREGAFYRAGSLQRQAANYVDIWTSKFVTWTAGQTFADPYSYYEFDDLRAFEGSNLTVRCFSADEEGEKPDPATMGTLWTINDYDRAHIPRDPEQELDDLDDQLVDDYQSANGETDATDDDVLPDRSKEIEELEKQLVDDYQSANNETDLDATAFIKDYPAALHETDVTRQYTGVDEVNEGGLRYRLRKDADGHLLAVVTGFGGEDGEAMTVPSLVFATVDDMRKSVPVARVGDGQPITGEPGSVVIPTGATDPGIRVAAQAFRDKQQLKTLRFEKNVIDPYAFAETPNLTTVDALKDARPQGQATSKVVIHGGAFQRAGTNQRQQANYLDIWTSQFDTWDEGQGKTFQDASSSYEFDDAGTFDDSNITVRAVKADADSSGNADAVHFRPIWTINDYQRETAPDDFEGIRHVSMYAIGDSYTAGNGTLGRWRTNSKAKNAIASITGIANPGKYAGTYRDERGKKVDSMRSPINYAGQAAKMLEKEGVHVTYENFANSGATITQSGDGSIVEQAQRVPEDADIVTMTAGGNDAQFSRIVVACLTVFSSPDHCRDMIQNANGSLDTIKENTQQVFEKLEERVANNREAHLMLFAYPMLIEQSEGYKITGTFGLKEYYVANNLRALQQEACTMQRKLVQEWNSKDHRLRIHYLEGHLSAFDQGGIIPTSLGYPYRLLNVSLETGGFSDPGNGGKTNWSYSLNPMNWYHPNISGHKEMARTLLEAIHRDCPETIAASKAKSATLLEDDSPAVYAEISGPYAVAQHGLLTLDAEGSYAASGIAKYEWDLNGDGRYDVETTQPWIDASFDELGEFQVRLRITTVDGVTAESTTTVEVDASDEENMVTTDDPQDMTKEELRELYEDDPELQDLLS